MKKWNHYTCPMCGGVTIARHDDEGVTPFLLRCRVKDIVTTAGRFHGCEGFADSSLFMGSQADDQVPHVVFFRPTDALEAIEEISKEPRRFRADLLDHWRQGGALMREVVSL